MLRIAAIADMHVAEDSSGKLSPHWRRLHECADALLLGGDLTNLGDTRQAEILARELEAVQIPMVAVFGNHDLHSNEDDKVRGILERAGVTMLEGETTTLRINSKTLGIAGTKGFGGGFAGACGHAFGEWVMKEFMRETERMAMRLEENLAALRTDYRIALLHYAPVKDTLAGERLEIYPFMGSYLLAEALDRAGADLVIHGHSHHGAEKGITAKGIPVRNVAMPLLKRAYTIYNLGAEEI
ncbi:MAG: 3',5'-cyclic adenosine monophosphate phosphodiesterase CpdA [Acidobacteria bacterium]|nr:3',5'-cyclic adenosine monophosphate phosphodiesterase CpdA [Acidobacteriota bacterium]